MEKTSFVYHFWADTLRIFATSSVIVVHLAFLTPGFVDTQTTSVMLFSLVKTCVPIFIMISGALLLIKNESTSQFYKKRLSRVMLPWLFWGGVYTFLNVISGDNLSVAEIGKSYGRTLLTLIWFIPIIVGLYALTPLVRKVIHTVPSYLIWALLSLWVAVIFLFPMLHRDPALLRTDHPVLFLQVILYSGYYVVGGVIQRMSLSQFRGLLVGGILFSGGFIWTLALVKSGYGYDSYDYLGINIALHSIGLFLLWKHLFSLVKHTERLQKVFSQVSKATLGVIFVHLLVISLLSHYSLLVDIPVLIVAFVVFVISLSIILFCQSIPGVRRLLT